MKNKLMLYLTMFLIIVIIFYYYYSNSVVKEGYYFKPSAKELVSHSMTAKQCQETCKSKPNCKYSYYSWATHHGGRGPCWNTKGKDKDQAPYGGKYRGGATWRNKNYIPKKPKMVAHHLRWYNRWPHCYNITCGSGTLKSFKEKCSENPRCDGFSWTRGRNSDSSRGGGCLKSSCKPGNEWRRGFGYGSHGYWLKGNEVSKIKDGMFIAIKNYQGRWLAAEPNGRIGHRGHRITWETFYVRKHPDGKNFLLLSYHGRYLSCFSPRVRSHYGTRPLRWWGWPWKYFNAWFTVYGTPNRGWGAEKIQFVKNRRGKWGIYFVATRRYLNPCTNQMGLGIPWHQLGEELRIYEVVHRNWGRRSREWNDIEIK